MNQSRDDNNFELVTPKKAKRKRKSKRSAMPSSTETATNSPTSPYKIPPQKHCRHSKRPKLAEGDSNGLSVSPVRLSPAQLALDSSVSTSLPNTSKLFESPSSSSISTSASLESSNSSNTFASSLLPYLSFPPSSDSFQQALETIDELFSQFKLTYAEFTWIDAHQTTHKCRISLDDPSHSSLLCSTHHAPLPIENGSSNVFSSTNHVKCSKEVSYHHSNISSVYNHQATSCGSSSTPLHSSSDFNSIILNHNGFQPSEINQFDPHSSCFSPPALAEWALLMLPISTLTKILPEVLPYVSSEIDKIEPNNPNLLPLWRESYGNINLKSSSKSEKLLAKVQELLRSIETSSSVHFAVDQLYFIWVLHKGLTSQFLLENGAHGLIMLKNALMLRWRGFKTTTRLLNILVQTTALSFGTDTFARSIFDSALLTHLQSLMTFMETLSHECQLQVLFYICRAFAFSYDLVSSFHNFENNIIASICLGLNKVKTSLIISPPWLELAHQFLHTFLPKS